MNDATFLGIGILCILTILFIYFGSLFYWVVRIKSFAERNGLSIDAKPFSYDFLWGREYTMAGILHGKEIKIVYPLALLYRRTRISGPFFAPKAQVRVYVNNELRFDEGYWYIKVPLRKVQEIIDATASY